MTDNNMDISSTSKGSKKYNFAPVRTCDMDLSDVSSSKTKAKTVSPKHKKYLPVRMCDMDLSEFLPKSKSKAVTQKPVKYAIPVRTDQMDWDLLGFTPAKKETSRRQLWPKIENKNITKSSRTNTSVTINKTKHGPSHDETLPLIDIENFERNPNLFKKQINPTYDKPKSTKNNRLVVKPKKINGPTVVTDVVNTLEFPPHKHETTRYKRETSSVKVLTPPKKPSSPVKQFIDENKLMEMFDEKINKLTNKLYIDEQKLVETFDKKISETTNKLEQKYNEIIKRLDKLEQEKNSLCKSCSKKSFSSTSSSSYAQNNLNNSCFIVETEKTEISHSPNSTPDDKNNTIIKHDENIKPKKLFDDEPETSQVQTTNIEDEKEVLKSFQSKINKFELLEAKLENDLQMTDELSFSDTDSPMLTKEDIASILNDKENKKLTKFVSTPTLVSIKKKSVKFLSKSNQDLHTDSFGTYNEMRDNAKFLCTPKNTKTLSNIMTPSIENSQKKAISRRVQKQILMLN